MNSSATRLKRPNLLRNGPIRNPLMPPRANNGGAGTAPRSGAPPDSAAPDAFAGKPREALECGVRTAYTVIDQYMQRGYEAARSNRDHPNGKGDMNNEKPNFGGWSSLWGPMAGPVEQWANAVRVWADAWSSFLPGGQAGPWQNPWTSFLSGQQPYGPMCGTPPPPASSAVSVRIISARPAEVTATLMPGAERMPLVADVPNLQGLSISLEACRVCVNLQVAAGQAAGTYRGTIKSDSRIVGDLTVIISDPPTTSA